jgi:RNA-binding protein Musashi
VVVAVGRGGEAGVMEAADHGKLFVGGISWETSEDRLREYFGRFGEVTEAVIMRDRSTGRARGFGFVVFADAAVAERVTTEKHMIDGRMVILCFRANSVVKLLPFFCLP